jgi:hypothetical protein
MVDKGEITASQAAILNDKKVVESKLVFSTDLTEQKLLQRSTFYSQANYKSGRLPRRDNLL